MDISFCKNIVIQYTQTFQYFYLSCLKLLPLSKSERGNEKVSYIYVWCIFYKCKMLVLKYHTLLSYFLCYTCTSGKSDAFCGYWMNVCFHSCMPLFGALCPLLRDSNFTDDVHLCALFFSTDDDVFLQKCFMCSTCIFLMFLLISVKEAFLYQIHICKFSVIVSVRNGKCITFKIPQLKEYVFYFIFWC